MRTVSKVTETALKDFRDELQKISTVGLACTSKSLLEKLSWTALLIIGLMWMVFVLTNQFQDWEENAGIVTKGKFELKYPAITICPKVSTKYAIAEQLGNFLDPSNLPDELISLRESFFLCGTGLLADMGNVHFLDITPEKAKIYYEDHCFKKSNLENSFKRCKVILHSDNLSFFVLHI